MPKQGRFRSSSTARARTLRRQATEAETKLWQKLRGGQIAGVRFRRQEPIGPYIVDFCSFDPKLVIEVDGGQHAERVAADERRTAFLACKGYRVLRFWNNEVLQNIAGVVEMIAAELAQLQRSQKQVCLRHPASHHLT
jgi:very-short-patch-repair endonuclease